MPKQDHGTVSRALKQAAAAAGATLESCRQVDDDRFEIVVNKANGVRYELSTSTKKAQTEIVEELLKGVAA